MHSTGQPFKMYYPILPFMDSNKQVLSDVPIPHPVDKYLIKNKKIGVAGKIYSVCKKDRWKELHRLVYLDEFGQEKDLPRGSELQSNDQENWFFFDGVRFRKVVHEHSKDKNVKYSLTKEKEPTLNPHLFLHHPLQNQNNSKNDSLVSAFNHSEITELQLLQIQPMETITTTIYLQQQFSQQQQYFKEQQSLQEQQYLQEQQSLQQTQQQYSQQQGQSLQQQQQYIETSGYKTEQENNFQSIEPKAKSQPKKQRNTFYYHPTIEIITECPPPNLSGNELQFWKERKTFGYLNKAKTLVKEVPAGEKIISIQNAYKGVTTYYWGPVKVKKLFDFKIETLKRPNQSNDQSDSEARAAKKSKR